MRSYSLLTEDDRYTVPTLLIIDAETEAEAREMAVEQLEQSEHHLSVELMLDDRLIMRRSKSDGHSAAALFSNPTRDGGVSPS